MSADGELHRIIANLTRRIEKLERKPFVRAVPLVDPLDPQAFRNYVKAVVGNDNGLGYSLLHIAPEGDATGIADAPASHHILPTTGALDTVHGILTTTDYAFFWTSDGELHRFRFSDDTEITSPSVSATFYPYGWCLISETQVMALTYASAYTLELHEFTDVAAVGAVAVASVPFEISPPYNNWGEWIISVVLANGSISLIWPETLDGAGGDEESFKIHDYNMLTATHTSTAFEYIELAGDEINGSPQCRPQVVDNKVLFHFIGDGFVSEVAGGDWNYKGSLFTYDIETRAIARTHSWSFNDATEFGTDFDMGKNGSGTDYQTGKIYLKGDGLNPAASEGISLTTVTMPGGTATVLFNAAVDADLGNDDWWYIISSVSRGLHFVNLVTNKILDADFVEVGDFTGLGDYGSYSSVLDEVGERVWSINSFGDLVGDSIVGAAQRVIDIDSLSLPYGPVTGPMILQGTRMIIGKLVLTA